MSEREKFERWWSDQPGSIRDDENFRWKAEYGFKAALCQIDYEHDDLVKELDELKEALHETQAHLWDHLTPEGHQLWHKIKAILAKYPEAS